MIDCEALLDQCWAMLNRKYEEVYGMRNYGYDKPAFEFVLSVEQIRVLRIYAADKGISTQVFIGVDKQELFGHPLVEQRRTPYLLAKLRQ